jgi:hypothetical protein
VTTSAERFGASLTETARIVAGAWRPSGLYAPLAHGERQWALDVTGLVGYRVVPTIEVSLEAAVGRQALTSPDLSTERTGFGDTTLRARWDALDEPMAYEKTLFPWPSLSVVAALRMPTSSAGRGSAESGFSGTTGSVGASASSEGLGAWEPGLGVALARTIAEKWQVSAYAEGAYRFEDSYLGIERHLSPRALVQVGGRYAPTASTGVGVFTDLGVEGDVAYKGETESGTRQRLWTLGAYGYVRVPPTGLRWGALVRYAPPFDHVGLNAARATSFAVSIGYAR